MGKGSKQRPTDHTAYGSSWDRIFSGSTGSDVSDDSDDGITSPTTSQDDTGARTEPGDGT